MFQFLKNIFKSNTNSLQPVLDKGAIIIDVRTAGEFKQGHLEGAKNIPLNELKLKADLIRGWGKPIITVCRSGARSQSAKSLLTSYNIESYNGGAWTSFQNKYTL